MNNQEFMTAVHQSGMLHWRMYPEKQYTSEYQRLQIPADRSLPLWDGADNAQWRSSSHGTLSFSLNDHIAVLSAPSRTEQWPEGSPEDGDYCDFGQLNADLYPSVSDWTGYNRLRFSVFPDCSGMHSPMLALQIFNDGARKLPDPYHREGHHIVHLRAGEWNDCIWEFPSLPRDLVTKLRFELNSYGKEVSMGDTLRYFVRDICLEEVSSVPHTAGWQCDPGQIVVPQNGYFAAGRKTAVSSDLIDSFSVVDSICRRTVFQGRAKLSQNEKGVFSVLDFSSVTQAGEYLIEAGDLKSPVFSISDDPLSQALWKGIHFLYCERCGTPIGRGHGCCHSDIIAKHNGTSLSYCGGWHDAGDVSQQTLQTGEVMQALFECAAAFRDSEDNDRRDLYFRMMEEAVWGLDFILKTRFGDGFRATSAGIRRWTDGLTGNFDDCSARVHDHAFENYYLSGAEAYAAMSLRELDPPLAWKCLEAAREDYAFAEKVFRERGMELPIYFEHTYNSSLSQYWATASWAASMIYDAGGRSEASFAEYARHYARLMLSCQETGSGAPFRGFFYREPDHRSIVHFNHQARYHIYAQALEALCRTQPDSDDRPDWEAGMRLHASYLKDMYSFAAPFGMMPAGLHRMDEYLDRETFTLMHLESPYEKERDNYLEQLKNGIPAGDSHCIRMFPVWFSFRGNTSVHLSEGKSASILGRYFHDDDLLQIAREQLYWIFGKNPFGQSLMYGEGTSFPQQYGALNGEMIGSMPVGIETSGNDDIPFWPVENNATYKEVWTTSAGRFYQIAADLEAM